MQKSRDKGNRDDHRCLGGKIDTLVADQRPFLYSNEQIGRIQQRLSAVRCRYLIVQVYVTKNHSFFDGNKLLALTIMIA